MGTSKQRAGSLWLKLIVAGTFGTAWTPAVAQQRPVAAGPPTYVTYANTNAIINRAAVAAGYIPRVPIAYSGDGNVYVPSSLVQGVPNNLISYVTTQGNAGANSVITSSAFRPAAGGMPAQFLFPTAPAAGLGNNSLGGLIDAFGWGSADVVMAQCFGGGYAFNMQGSLQGATPSAPPGAARIAAVNQIGYTFASAANYNEYSFGVALPNGAAGPATMTALGDLTQGQAYAETAGPPFTMYAAYQNGRAADPFTVGGAPYGAFAPNFQNQVPGAPGAPNLQGGLFESPVYASSDAPNANGSPNLTAAAAPNNTRGYGRINAALPPGNGMGQVNNAANNSAANTWAVLVGFTPDRSEFSLDIQREYAALISEGVQPSHIAVLYGDGSSGSLTRFTNINGPPNNNNIPNVNGQLNAVGANFAIPVQGAASNVNIAGLLNPSVIYNPAAAAANRVDYWQQLFNPNNLAAAVAAPRPAAGSRLVLYTTGHGSAVNVKGGELTAANRAVGNGVFRTDFQLDGAGNVVITAGTNITAQITMRGLPAGIGSDVFSVDGQQVGLATPANVTPGSSLDMSPFIASGASGLDYVDLTIPDDDFMPMGGGSVFDLSIGNTSSYDVQQFQDDFAGFTWLNGDATPNSPSPTDLPDLLSECAAGECDLYTDLVSVPEPSTWAMMLAGFIGLGFLGFRSSRKEAPLAG